MPAPSASTLHATRRRRYTAGVLTALWHQFVMSVRLQPRNPTALAYIFAIPLVFLGTIGNLLSPGPLTQSTKPSFPV